MYVGPLSDSYGVCTPVSALLPPSLKFKHGEGRRSKLACGVDDTRMLGRGTKVTKMVLQRMYTRTSAEALAPQRYPVQQDDG